MSDIRESIRRLLVERDVPSDAPDAEKILAVTLGDLRNAVRIVAHPMFPGKVSLAIDKFRLVQDIEKQSGVPVGDIEVD